MIGLVSYHREPNYGTMLQAYALAAAINSLGKECEYINYRPVYQCLWIVATVRRLAAAAYHLVWPPHGEFDYYKSPAFANIKRKYEEFHRRHIAASPRIYNADTIVQANQKYEYFIVGSDQTWSRYMNREATTINFLPFVTASEKRHSYAPSIGSIHLTDDYKERLRRELMGFASLSCRERENCVMLSQLLGRPVEYVVDPTLLLKPEDWKRIEKRPMQGERYILAYILGTKECITEFAERLGREKGMSVYYILTRPEYCGRPHVLEDVGPEEFVGLVHDAEYVVTDSFHGSMFSINFCRNFYCFAKRSVAPGEITYDNDRILSFLRELGLTERFREDGDGNFSEDIDYDNVLSTLEKLRQSSWLYLSSILE